MRETKEIQAQIKMKGKRNHSEDKWAQYPFKKRKEKQQIQWKIK